MYRKFALLVAAASALGILGFVIHLISSDHYFIATLWLLPAVVLALAFAIPGRGPAHYAMTKEVFRLTPEESDPPYLYHFRLAGRWGLAGLCLPIALLTLKWSIIHDNRLGEFEALLILPIPAFGIACLLKSIGELFRGVKLLPRAR